MLMLRKPVIVFLATVSMMQPTVSYAEEPTDVTLEESKDCYILYSTVSGMLADLGLNEASLEALETSLTWYRAILVRLDETTERIDAEIAEESAELKGVVDEALASDQPTRDAMQQRLTALKGQCDALENKFLKGMQ